MSERRLLTLMLLNRCIARSGAPQRRHAVTAADSELGGAGTRNKSIELEWETITHRGTQVGVGNLRFCNIVGPKWELGTWEFIARNDIVGGHLGKQKHCYHVPV